MGCLGNRAKRRFPRIFVRFVPARETKTVRHQFPRFPVLLRTHLDMRNIQCAPMCHLHGSVQSTHRSQRGGYREQAALDRRPFRPADG